MDKLIDGYRRFRRGHWKDKADLYQALAVRQREAAALIIACSDSRADPAFVFDADPGDLFVVRNVANLVPPCERGEGLHGTSAAIEFAVTRLKVRLILVLGHARCGGCAAAIDGVAPDPEGTSFLDDWIQLLAPARARVPADAVDPHTALEYESIRLSVERLQSFPFVADRVAGGLLDVQGARFSIFDGRLEILDRATGRFEAVP